MTTQTQTITTELTQCLYQPGDGTCYRITWVQVPPKYAGDPDPRPQHLITISTNLSRSMYFDLGPGCYLHPTYAQEKLGPDTGYLSRILAHFVNMRFCSTYGGVLRNFLDATPEDRSRYLPTPFASNASLMQELLTFDGLLDSPPPSPPSANTDPEITTAGIAAALNTALTTNEECEFKDAVGHLLAARLATPSSDPETLVSIWCSGKLWHVSEGPCSELEAMTELVRKIAGDERTLRMTNTVLAPQDLAGQTADGYPVYQHIITPQDLIDETEDGYPVYEFETINLTRCKAANFDPRECWDETTSYRENASYFIPCPDPTPSTPSTPPTKP